MIMDIDVHVLSIAPVRPNTKKIILTCRLDSNCINVKGLIWSEPHLWQ